MCELSINRAKQAQVGYPERPCRYSAAILSPYHLCPLISLPSSALPEVIYVEVVVIKVVFIEAIAK